MPETNGKTTEARPRKFVFNGMQLADPDPKMTPQKDDAAEGRGVPLSASRGTDQRYDQGTDEDCGRIR